jgi:hypothetical protein
MDISGLKDHQATTLIGELKHVAVAAALKRCVRKGIILDGATQWHLFKHLFNG